MLSDLNSLRRMIHNTIDVSYSKVYPERAVQFFKDFHSNLKIRERSQKGKILIFEKNLAIAATGALVGNEVLGVFVSPINQHCGYGKLIMNELERVAKTKGLDQITLSVSLPSRRFYEAIGYEIVGPGTIDVGEGQHLDYWEARKRITVNPFIEKKRPGKAGHALLTQQPCMKED